MTEARRILARIAALPELTMQSAVLREELLTRHPANAVALLYQLVTAGQAVVAVARALDSLPYDQRSELYVAAKEAELPEVASLLFEIPRPDPLPIEDRRALTLGERKAMARGSRREALARLLADPDAKVIAVLLGNPRVTERDVVAIAARRPARADVFRAVFESRWVARYAVKLALIFNPHTPVDIALRLLSAMSSADLRRVSGDPNLAAALREQARRLTSSR